MIWNGFCWATIPHLFPGNSFIEHQKHVNCFTLKFIAIKCKKPPRLIYISKKKLHEISGQTVGVSFVMQKSDKILKSLRPSPTVKYFCWLVINFNCQFKIIVIFWLKIPRHDAAWALGSVSCAENVLTITIVITQTNFLVICHATKTCSQVRMCCHLNRIQWKYRYYSGTPW